RDAATVPQTSRSIWARRASSPAMVATSRLDSMSAPVTVVAVDVGLVAAQDLASRFPAGEAIRADAAELAVVLSGDQQQLAGRGAALQGAVGLGGVGEGITGADQDLDGA